MAKVRGRKPGYHILSTVREQGVSRSAHGYNTTRPVVTHFLQEGSPPKSFYNLSKHCAQLGTKCPNKHLWQTLYKQTTNITFWLRHLSISWLLVVDIIYNLYTMNTILSWNALPTVLCEHASYVSILFGGWRNWVNNVNMCLRFCCVSCSAWCFVFISCVTSSP